jgi:SAM-dependent methyltransferase
MCKAIFEVLHPVSVIDVGCAVGELVAYFCHSLKLDAYGLDGSPACAAYFQAPKDRLFIRDLRVPFDLEQKFDLAICLEVLEHIEEEFAGGAVENLTRLSDTVVLSAATVGQGGVYHVNCQYQTYWYDKFSNLSFRYAGILTQRIKQRLAPVAFKKEMSAWYGNLMVFVKNGGK